MPATAKSTKKLKPKQQPKTKLLKKPARSSNHETYDRPIGSRRLKQPRYQSFKLQKRIKPLYPKLPSCL